MFKFKYKNPKITIFVISVFFLLINGIFHRDKINLATMPKEYKTIKKIVDEFAYTNDLGKDKITFTITAGTYANLFATEIGLCENEVCDYYSNLNPFNKYKRIKGIDINQLINQTYLLNGIEAAAWSHGLIWISRSTFQTFGNNNNYLACVIAHEISHIINNDSFNNKVKLSENKNNWKSIKNIKNYKRKEELLKKRISRETETKADFLATRLISNTGLPKNTCLRALKFIAEKSSMDVETKLDDTHPGFIERYSSLDNFITQNNFQGKVKMKNKNWSWIYNKDKNSLIFIPNKKNQSFFK